MQPLDREHAHALGQLPGGPRDRIEEQIGLVEPHPEAYADGVAHPGVGHGRRHLERLIGELGGGVAGGDLRHDQACCQPDDAPPCRYRGLSFCSAPVQRTHPYLLDCLPGDPRANR